MYSQNGEDDIILQVVKSWKNPNHSERTVLDIGANDGVSLSNSRALIELGWKGILIEPDPTAFVKLLTLYGENPKVTLLNAAVGTERRITKFFRVPSDYSMLHTTLPREGVNFHWVPQVTPSDLVNELGCCADVISIDTEGTSYEILTQLPIGSWAPTAIIVEHDGRILEITGFGKKHKYRVGDVNGENVVLVKA